MASAQLAHTEFAALDGRRREARLPIGRMAILRDGDEPVEVRLLDLTREGCRIESEQPLGPGMTVRLGIAGIGPVDAIVRWSGGASYGCEFTLPLPEGSVTAAVACNVATLPIGRAIELRRPTLRKWPRAGRTVMLAGLAVGPWIVIGGVALLALR